MARNKFCVRVDKLSSEQRRDLHSKVNDLVSEYNKKISQQEEQEKEEPE